MGHQLLVYADDVNLLGENIDTVKNTVTVLPEACSLFAK
jgi:hypothetical protein